ncbi:MAG: hypothetical protein V7636_1931 [Actinomycetota bacterium]|jgi:uncharacterized protein (DUF305 family)
MDRRRRRSLLAAVVLAAIGVASLSVATTVSAGNEPSKVDVGFLQDMIDHHDQANLLSLVALHGDASPVARNLAVDVLTSQRYEIGIMDEWLRAHGLSRGGPSRTAMTWMGMHVTPATMPGMATQPQIDALSRLTGAALDRQFFMLMIEHHEGGIHMASAAAKTATDGHVRWLAGQMARNQRREIMEIQSVMATLPSTSG